MSATLSPTAIRRRYYREIGLGAVGYIGSVLIVSLLISDEDPISVGGVALMLVPAIFLLLITAAMWRYLSSVDEILRAHYSRALLIAAFAVLSISGAWGLMELMNANLPKLPVFFVFPIFMGVFGLAASTGKGRGMGCA